MNLNRRAQSLAGLGALNHSLRLAGGGELGGFVGEVLCSTGFVEHGWVALTEEVQLEVFVSSLKCFLVNTLAVLPLKFEAVPMCGVIALFTDTHARAEVDISAVMIVVPADSVS